MTVILPGAVSGLTPILSMLRDVALRIGEEIPERVFSSTERSEQEIASLCNEAAQDVRDSFNWEILKKAGGWTGDGTTTAFSLPSDFHRMPADAAIWSDARTRPLTHIKSVNVWLEAINGIYVDNAWTKRVSDIHFHPVPGDGVALTYYYMSDQIVVGEGTPPDLPTKATFTSDTDSFLLDEKLLRLGIIYKWKAAKNLPHETDLANYQEAIEAFTGWDQA